MTPFISIINYLGIGLITAHIFTEGKSSLKEDLLFLFFWPILLAVGFVISAAKILARWFQ